VRYPNLRFSGDGMLRSVGKKLFHPKAFR
jgi:hypothetical protein